MAINTNTPDDRALYPVQDACRYLGVRTTKLYELMNSGDVETVKIGRRRLVIRFGDEEVH